MSEEFKCPSCGGTASIAYYRAGNNLLYCHDCQKAFSEVGAKIMKQAARIAELEAENERLRKELNLIGTKADFCADECEYGPDATSFRSIADDANRALKRTETWKSGYAKAETSAGK